MKIVEIDPRTDPIWHTLVSGRNGSVFHSHRWLQVLNETYDLEPRAYILMDKNEQALAGIPFCRIEDVRGERFVSLPFSDYCDPLVENPEQWRMLAERFMQQGDLLTLRCLHNSVPLADEGFTVVNQAKWHGLDLPDSLETLWENLSSSARRAIRKAERQQVVVRQATAKTDLRMFYDMHLAIRKSKYRLLAQPYSFFESIWRHFCDDGAGTLLIVCHNDKVIAATLFLEWKGTLYYKFNASSPGATTLRPNDLMIWEAIKYAKGKNYAKLDFGLSDWDQEGLVRFKRKYATEEKTISFLQSRPEGQHTAQALRVQQLLPQLTDLFTDDETPDHVTEKAGEILYRFFA